MGALAVAARRHGIARFTADVLQENTAIRAISSRHQWEPIRDGAVLHGVTEVPNPAPSASRPRRPRRSASWWTRSGPGRGKLSSCGHHRQM